MTEVEMRDGLKVALKTDFSDFLTAVAGNIGGGRVVRFDGAVGLTASGHSFRVLLPEIIYGTSEWDIPVMDEDFAVISEKDFKSFWALPLRHLQSLASSSGNFVRFAHGEPSLLEVWKRSKTAKRGGTKVGSVHVGMYAGRASSPLWRLDLTSYIPVDDAPVSAGYGRRDPSVNNALVDSAATHETLPEWLAGDIWAPYQDCLLSSGDLVVFDDHTNDSAVVYKKKGEERVVRYVLGGDARLAILGVVDEGKEALGEFVRSLDLSGARGHSDVPEMARISSRRVSGEIRGSDLAKARGLFPARPKNDPDQGFGTIQRTPSRLGRANASSSSGGSADKRADELAVAAEAAIGRTTYAGRGVYSCSDGRLARVFIASPHRDSCLSAHLRVDPDYISEQWLVVGIEGSVAAWALPTQAIRSFVAASDPQVVPDDGIWDLCIEANDGGTSAMWVVGEPKRRAKLTQHQVHEFVQDIVEAVPEHPKIGPVVMPPLPEHLKIGPVAMPPISPSEPLGVEADRLRRRGQAELGYLEEAGRGVLSTVDGGSVRMLLRRQDPEMPGRMIVPLNTGDFRHDWLLAGMSFNGSAWLVPMEKVSTLLLQWDYTSIERGVWECFIERRPDGRSYMGMLDNRRHSAEVTEFSLTPARTPEEIRDIEAASIKYQGMGVRVRNLEGWATGFVRPLGRHKVFASDDIVLLDDPSGLTGYVVDEQGYAMEMKFNAAARRVVLRAGREGTLEEEVIAMVEEALGTAPDEGMAP